MCIVDACSLLLSKYHQLAPVENVDDEEPWMVLLLLLLHNSCCTEIPMFVCSARGSIDRGMRTPPKIRIRTTANSESLTCTLRTGRRDRRRASNATRLFRSYVQQSINVRQEKHQAQTHTQYSVVPVLLWMMCCNWERLHKSKAYTSTERQESVNVRSAATSAAPRTYLAL